MWGYGKNMAFGDKADPGYNASSRTYYMPSNITFLSLHFPICKNGHIMLQDC